MLLELRISCDVEDACAAFLECHSRWSALNGNEAAVHKNEDTMLAPTSGLLPSATVFMGLKCHGFRLE